MRYLLASCLVLAACSDGTGPGRENALLVLPAVDTIPVESSVQFRAVQLGPRGDTVEVRDVVWSSRDPDIAPVNADGVVTGIRSGQVTVVALAGDLRGTADVRVERRFQAKDVATGVAGLCAVDLGGQIWCEGGWGTGAPFPDRDTTDIRTFRAPVSGSERYTLVGSNQSFACGLSTARQLLCWGYFILGSSLSAGIPTPIAPALMLDTLSVHGSMGCGLADQTAHCWGHPTMDSVMAVRTEGIPLVSLDVQGHEGCGWAADGTRLCWDRTSAYPDDEVILQPSTPGVPRLERLVSGYGFFCGLDADKQAWCWGVNDQGQLGNGLTAGSPDPVPVAGGHQFTLLSASAGSGQRVCGIAEDNQLFCWGAGFGSVPEAVLY